VFFVSAQAIGDQPPMGSLWRHMYEQKYGGISIKPGYPDLIASFILGIA
jgi:hypothetical protein